MKVIVTHTNTDFDALGALVAAHKLHPDAVPVIGHYKNGRVEEFLRLHKDALHLNSVKSINWDNVTDVILVDFHDLKRGEGLDKIKDKSKINWIVYDHHPEQELTEKASYFEVKETGSTVGILVQHLKEKKIEPNFLESTIMAIGIYTDTGHLTFPNTTVEDVLAVAWLLENNADLNIVSEYTSLTLQDEQIDLVNRLMEKIEIIEFGLTKILISYYETDNYITDLAVVTHKLSEFYNVDVIFVVVKMGKWSYIIGRSSNSSYNLLSVLSDFKPKGHKQACFTKVKENPNEIVDVIKKKVEDLKENRLTAKDLMSSPVRTISKNEEIEKANKLMLRYGHNGFVVAENDVLDGIISRRDIEKAMHHKMNHSKVQDFMTKFLLTISPDTPFDDIEKLMIDNNIGRFPVIEKGKLVGIVTRSDILKAIYHKEVKEENVFIGSGNKILTLNIKDKVEKYFSKDVLDFLKLAGKIGDEMGYKIFLVGGGVRDLIIGKGKDVDIDIVVEGNGIRFAKKIAEKYSVEIVTHQKYGTAKIKLFNDTIDVATSRTEFYEFPAANPDVDFSTIKQDLYRRDFTINALAMELNTKSFGKILDFFSGYKDLNEKRIKILHNLSFIEDPNRIFRAVRLEQKLGFKIDDVTQEFAVRAMNTGKFDYFINDRIKNELKKIFKNDYYPVSGIKRLYNLQALRCFTPKLEYENIDKQIQYLYKYIQISKSKFNLEINEWILYTAVLLNQIRFEDKFQSMLNKLKLTSEEENTIILTKNLKQEVLKIDNWKDLPNSDIYFFWKKYTLEALIYAMSTLENKDIKRTICIFWTELKDIKTEVKGNLLKDKGLKGREIGDILETVLLAKLNTKVKTKEDEIKYIEKLLNK